jgi:glycosyltransferase involved in cell wall biosynthesis
LQEFPSISVILPVFMRNISSTHTILLRQALESVADQKYRGPIEVVLIDDGSPHPVQNLSNFLGPAIKLVRWIRFPSNMGIVSALNAGIMASDSRLIARIDADDTWIDGKLDAQISQFSNDPDLTISATGMVRVDNKGNKIDTHVRPGDWSEILSWFVHSGCPFPHGSIVADRRIYRLLGGYPWSGYVRHCEDYALWGMWLRFFKPAMVEEALYSYRVSSSSVSSEFAEQQGKASQNVRRSFEKLNISQVLPTALSELAEALGGSLYEAGLLAYTIWHFRTPFAIPESAITPLMKILPDRVLISVPSAPNWRRIIGGADAENQDMHALRADSILL